MCGQRGLERDDLVVQFADDPDRGAGGRAERRGDRGRGGELIGTQRRLDLSAACVDVALASTAFE